MIMTHLFFFMLFVRVLFPTKDDRVDEEEVAHVEHQQADHADDHHHHHLDHGGVPLLVPAHTPGTESLRKLLMFFLNIEAGDDNIEAVTVAEIINDDVLIKEQVMKHLGGTFLI